MFPQRLHQPRNLFDQLMIIAARLSCEPPRQDSWFECQTLSIASTSLRLQPTKCEFCEFLFDFLVIAWNKRRGGWTEQKMLSPPPNRQMRDESFFSPWSSSRRNAHSVSRTENLSYYVQRIKCIGKTDRRQWYAELSYACIHPVYPSEKWHFYGTQIPFGNATFLHANILAIIPGSACHKVM